MNLTVLGLVIYSYLFIRKIIVSVLCNYVISACSIHSRIWSCRLVPELQLERVQHTFLLYAAFKLNLPLLQHYYSDICRILNIPFLLSRRNDVDSQFIYALLNNLLNAPDLLSPLSHSKFLLITLEIKSLWPFYIPTHSNSYSHNHPLYKMLRSANLVYLTLIYTTHIYFTMHFCFNPLLIIILLSQLIKFFICYNLSLA